MKYVLFITLPYEESLQEISAMPLVLPAPANLTLCVPSRFDRLTPLIINAYRGYAASDIHFATYLRSC